MLEQTAFLSFTLSMTFLSFKMLYKVELSLGYFGKQGNNFFYLAFIPLTFAAINGSWFNKMNLD
jgi:hypothetical protein